MSMVHQTPPRLWSIILVGGENHFVHSITQRWLGHRKPKPFCAFVGSRSMLQHTWDRADQLSHPECKITVVGKNYLHETCSQLGGRVPGMIITEPQNCGTLASLFLSLAHLQTRDPQATVVVYPADHFVHPESLFLKTIQRVIWATERIPDHIILVGANQRELSTDGPHTDYIHRDRQLGWVFTSPIYAVTALEGGQPANGPGGREGTSPLLNTRILVGRVPSIWKLGWTTFPNLMTQFEEFKDAIGTSYERAELKKLYRHLAGQSPSLTSLFQSSDNLAVMELEGVTWSTWDRPDQIIELANRLGKHPNFSIEEADLSSSAVSGPRRARA